MPRTLSIQVPGGDLDVTISSAARTDAPVVATAHPTESMAAAVPLLSEITGLSAVAIDVRGTGASSASIASYGFDEMVEDLEAVRRRLGLGKWVFWGSSGGSMLGQWYAITKPDGLAAIILDSAGPSFRATLEDSACLMSPNNPRWSALTANKGQPGWSQPLAGVWMYRDQEGEPNIVTPVEPTSNMREFVANLLGFDA